MAQERVELERVSPEGGLRPLRPGYPSLYSEPRSSGYGYSADEGKINFRGSWRTIRKHKILILIFAVITTCIATLEIYRTKSVYQASASIQIQKNNAAIVKTGDM